MLEQLKINRRKETLDLNLTFYTTVNSKWIINLNAKWKTIKLLEENIGENVYELGFDQEFWTMPPKKKGGKNQNQ